MRHLALIFLTALLAQPSQAQDRTDFVRPDVFGYTTDTSCPALFNDIDASGTALNLSDNDDGGAVLSLNQSFSFYGNDYASLIVSSNGYLAFGTDLADDAGADFSNDCPLPAVPDQGPASPQRIMVLHDDLEPVDGDSEVLQQHFADCPRPSDSLATEACTIVQWSGWRPIGSAANLSAQVVLYHASGDIALQYQGLNLADANGATIGIQNASSAAMLSCNRDAITAAAACLSTFSNTPPVANADAIALDEGASATLLSNGDASVRNNDTDAEDGTPSGTVALVMGPAEGALALEPDGTFQYDHDGSETTSDSFTYTVTDSSGAVSNTAQVSISINPINDMPIAADDSASGLEGGLISALDGGSSSILSNDDDAEDGVPNGAITIDQQPNNGLLTVNLDGTFSYQHDDSETTSDSFTYTVADNDGALSNTATVSITIAPVNDPPEAQDDELVVLRGANVDQLQGGALSVRDNDTDAEDGTPTGDVMLETPPGAGQLTLNPDGTFVYQHDGSAGGSDSFSYRVGDSAGALSLPAIVNIVVDEPPSELLFSDGFEGN